MAGRAEQDFLCHSLLLFFSENEVHTLDATTNKHMGVYPCNTPKSNIPHIHLLR